jgi:glycosyltransferase involved in cell wall biosynthesis
MSENDTKNGKGRCPSVIAVIPCHNEERFIGSVVLKARKYVDAVIVVDDGSSDCTGEVAECAGAIVVRHDHNHGKGAALNTGFRKARDLGPEAILTVDGDWQHLAEEMPRVVAPVLERQADIVVGSRYLEKNPLVPLHRILGHRAFTFLTNLLSGVGVTDSQSGFRAFSPRAAAAIDFSSAGFSVESEMQFLAREHDLKVVEVPITSRYEDKPKRNVVIHGMGVLNGVLRLAGQYRPLLFFGVPGMTVLLAGLAWGAWVVEIYRRSQTLAVGYAMISVLLATLGSLSLFAGIILHSVRGLLLELVGTKAAAQQKSVSGGQDELAGK